MMYRILQFGLLLYCLTLIACTDEPDFSPQEIVRMYQAYIDQNEFQKAGQLSTEAEQKRLVELEQMIGVYADSTVLRTAFDQIDCTVTIDTAICTCILTDQYETYDAEFVLIKKGTEWLVDLPREEEVDYDEEIEAILDSLIQEN